MPVTSISRVASGRSLNYAQVAVTIHVALPRQLAQNGPDQICAAILAPMRPCWHLYRQQPSRCLAGDGPCPDLSVLAVALGPKHLPTPSLKQITRHAVGGFDPSRRTNHDKWIVSQIDWITPILHL